MQGELCVRGTSPECGNRRRGVCPNGPVETVTEEVIHEIQDLMWEEVGIVRSAAGLERAVQRLKAIRPQLTRPRTRRGWEALNLCQLRDCCVAR